MQKYNTTEDTLSCKTVYR